MENKQTKAAVLDKAWEITAESRGIGRGYKGRQEGSPAVSGIWQEESGWADAEAFR